MAHFELIDPRGAPAPPGPWQTRAAAASFSSAGGAEAAAPVWRIDLPADPLAALADLAAAEAQLGRHEAALAATPERIAALAASGGAVSFSAQGLPAPERQLLAMLNAQQPPMGGPAGASAFSIGQDEASSWAEAEQRFRAFAGQVQDAVTNFAVVETLIEGLLVARTSVGWTGDMRSLLATSPRARYSGLHRRSLGLALGSRTALLKTFGTVMRGAALVAVMAGSPAGAVMALPAAWRFVEQLLGDLRGP